MEPDNISIMKEYTDLVTNTWPMKFVGIKISRVLCWLLDTKICTVNSTEAILKMICIIDFPFRPFNRDSFATYMSEYGIYS